MKMLVIYFNCFRIGRSCIENVFIIKQTIEKRREFNLETHMAFLDLEKLLIEYVVTNYGKFLIEVVYLII
jgi:hypothetical protein